MHAVWVIGIIVESSCTFVCFVGAFLDRDIITGKNGDVQPPVTFAACSCIEAVYVLCSVQRSINFQACAILFSGPRCKYVCMYVFACIPCGLRMYNMMAFRKWKPMLLSTPLCAISALSLSVSYTPLFLFSLFLCLLRTRISPLSSLVLQQHTNTPHSIYSI